MFNSLSWTARYYQHPLGEVLHTALPAGLRSGRNLPDAGERALMLAPGKVASAPPRTGSRVAALLELLAAGPIALSRLDTLLPGWRNAAISLKRRGLITATQFATNVPLRTQIDAPPLTVEQQQAIAEIASGLGEFSPTLLEGITGSGKTEVYLALIERTIARGQQALVLVPEIGLTPQALRRFRDRLPGRVEMLHSGLSDGERTRTWLAAARGEAQVILGTRSAVFTPLVACRTDRGRRGTRCLVQAT